MTQLPAPLYTKCFKYELEQKIHTLSDTGVCERFFFDNPEILIKKVGLSESEVVVKVLMEAFCGSSLSGNSPRLKYVEDGIWTNNSPLLMKFLSAL